MSDEKKNPSYDEQALARVLEAAFVLQEHQDELGALKGELARRRKQTFAAAETTNRARIQEAPADLRNEPGPGLLNGSDPSDPDKKIPAAANAIEEHPEEQPEPEEIEATRTAPDSDQVGDAGVLTPLLEAQRQIKERQLSTDEALSLIAERLIDITGAAGSAIGVLDGNLLRYRAAAGFRTPAVGSAVPADKAPCAPCLRRGQTFRCPDVNPEFLINTEECRLRGIGSLIAVPVHRDDSVIGGMELYYSDPHAFSERDVESCQLMAGLITNLFSRHDASEATGAQRAMDAKAAPHFAPVLSKPATAPAQVCYKCGHELVEDEQFCGQCGSPRSGTTQALSSLQSKVASLWHMQEANRKNTAAVEVNSARPDSTTALQIPSDEPRTEEAAPETEDYQTGSAVAALDLPSENANLAEDHRRNSEDFAAPLIPSLRGDIQSSTEDESASSLQPQESEDSLPKESETKAPAIDWSSAFSAREFLEQFNSDRQGALLRFWNARRADIYLAVAIILVICVLSWGIWSDHPRRSTPAPATTTTTATAATHPKPAEPTLPLFDRMLIAIGLAEAPEPPPDKGNPSTQVWVDLHTALYYCPGADMYGKTPKGKYTSQREAQLDQFEPAYRKNCN